MIEVFERDPRIKLVDLAELVKAHFRLDDSEVIPFLSAIKNDFGRDDCDGYEMFDYIYVLEEVLNQKYSCCCLAAVFDFWNNLTIVTEQQKHKITTVNIMRASAHAKYEYAEHLYSKLSNPFDIEIEVEMDEGVYKPAFEHLIFGYHKTACTSFIILKALEAGRTDVIKKIIDGSNNRYNPTKGINKAYAQFLAEGKTLPPISGNDDIAQAIYLPDEGIATFLAIEEEYQEDFANMTHAVPAEEEKVALWAHLQYLGITSRPNLETIYVGRMELISSREQYLTALEENGKLLGECSIDFPENADCRLNGFPVEMLIRIASFLPPSKNNIEKDIPAYGSVRTGFFSVHTKHGLSTVDEAKVEENIPEGPSTM